MLSILQLINVWREVNSFPAVNSPPTGKDAEHKS